MNLHLLLIFFLVSSSAAPMHASNFLGAANASTAVPTGKEGVFVGNDEDETIHLYHLTGGEPIGAFDFSKELRAKKHADKEVDIEASTRIGNRIYWLGSHSNKKNDGKIQPNRHRLFATDISSETNLVYVGRYDGLRSDLIEWDQRNFHLGLEQAAAAGVSPEEPDGKGFNIEGLAIAPDAKTALIGFRAPLIVTNGRPHALLVPVLNLPNLISSSATRARFCAPILLDLGGRGIRSIETFTNMVLIVAGPAATKGDFRLFVWDGDPTHPPTLCDAVLDRVGSERKLHPEAIVGFVEGTAPDKPEVQLLSDDGKNELEFDGFRSFNVPVCPLSLGKK
ncbi:MAG: DUF3616 domain-containing protein [Verrucomicrobiota bacterium]